MRYDGGRKNLSLRLYGSFCQFGSYVALSGTSKTAIDKSKKDNYSTNDVIDTKIMYPENIKDNPCSIQRYYKNGKHS